MATRFFSALCLFIGFVIAVPASHAAGDPPSCRAVRLADVGWTDVTATTGVLSRLLSGLGYQPQTRVLSLPVTFNGLARKDVDVFLGNWLPMQNSQIKSYIENGSIERVRVNLADARYTLAVPRYLYDEGLHDFSDIAKFGDQLDHKIYGIEPGNDGNGYILEMIADNRFDLGNFTLVESSEQGMLAQVERAVREQRPIVFLGWQPHPMNDRFDMRYLSGGDDTFGPNYGGATVNTVVRRGYLKECPNVGRLLHNLEFKVEDENALMAGVTASGNAEQAAEEWMAKHPERLKAWLKGVTTFDGAPAHETLSAGLAPSAGGNLITRYKIPVGAAMTDAVEWTKAHGAVLDLVARAVSVSVKALTSAMNAVPPLVFIALATVLTWFLRKSKGLTLFVPLALLFILNQGYWVATIETLALVVFAAATSTVIGVPIGIWAGHRPRAYEYLRSVLDLMQTLPTFVYLIPTLVIFGLGIVPGLISTIIFSLPAPIRLTQLGIASVPRPLIEAGESFGATRRQLLFKIELPAAAGSILAGVTQCIMLSLSMVVIAALVGAGGLGVPVVRALNTVQVGMGFEAGFAIVLLAIILDRVTRRETKGDV
ncbi:choline ABC transporter permease subunit [Novosphingobium beihaiensis]|uniref:Choline ABC transporter permease subunit n=1 Tax=Novosphingobium beihaiensis TaxID=2930389 RepID=A0ABT0BU23_9SPHN|nr:choline ABC transporter permease subunit [Novosphingobium beihaiensis]MCJ2188468.1 choline ABC transporter permease subunit [Novosphingobium beihaiensis]